MILDLAYCFHDPPTLCTIVDRLVLLLFNPIHKQIANDDIIRLQVDVCSWQVPKGYQTRLIYGTFDGTQIQNW